VPSKKAYVHGLPVNYLKKIYKLQVSMENLKVPGNLKLYIAKIIFLFKHIIIRIS
jgi:hypothetical protein